jgi:hypothetical protein
VVHDDRLSALTRQRDEINAQIAALQSEFLAAAKAPQHQAPQNAPLHLDLTRDTYPDTSRRIDFDEGRSEGKAMYVSEYLPSSQKVSYVSSWDDHPSEINNRIVADYSDFNSNFSNVSDNNPLCACGTPSLKLVARTDANMNREFYRCAASNVTNRCQFFQWVDGDSISAVSNQSTPSSNVDYMVANKRIFGHNRLREGQRECIEAALEGLSCIPEFRGTNDVQGEMSFV